jgi:hypothetical protein
MDIKKADSKGRVSGFKASQPYEVEVQDRGRIILTPIITPAQIAELGPEAIEQFRVLSEFCLKVE